MEKKHMYQGLIRSVKESMQALLDTGKMIDRERRKEWEKGGREGGSEGEREGGGSTCTCTLHEYMCMMYGYMYVHVHMCTAQ